MQAIITASIALTGLFGIGLWVGYRLGFNNGLATWRKDYAKMRPIDIMHHKRIIERMHDGQPTAS